MWVQCKEAAHAVAIDKHFEGVTFTLSSGIVSTCHVARPVLGCETCCWIVPTNLFRGAVTTDAEAQTLTEAGARMYAKLKGAPTFWLALAGVECDEVRTEKDARDMLRHDHAPVAGLVVSLKTWRDAAEPEGFERFRPGYMWRPYTGASPPAHR